MSLFFVSSFGSVLALAHGKAFGLVSPGGISGSELLTAVLPVPQSTLGRRAEFEELLAPLVFAGEHVSSCFVSVLGRESFFSLFDLFGGSMEELGLYDTDLSRLPVLLACWRSACRESSSFWTSSRDFDLSRLRGRASSSRDLDLY